MMYRTLVIPLVALTATLVVLERPARADYGTDGVSCAFTNLQDAVDDAGPGGTVHVQAGANVVSGETQIDDSVTLRGSDANCNEFAIGYATLMALGSERILDVTDAAYVNLTRLTLTGGYTTDSGGLVRLQGGSTLQANDSTFESGTAVGNGGCVAAYQSDVFLLGSDMTLCTASGNGGNLYLNLSDVLVDGGSTVRNGSSSSGDGGNIFAEGSEVSMFGQLHGGFAATNGGGIAAIDVGIASVVNISGDADVFDNHASWGGGIYVAGLGSSLVVEDDAIVADNTADAGGGILVESWAVARIQGDASVSDNAADRGAGIRDGLSAVVELADDAVLARNVADKAGGGISAVDSTVTAEGSVVLEANEALSEDDTNQGGGGIRLNDSTLVASGLTLSQNDAGAGRGGGILALSGSSVELTNGDVNANNAGEGGGLYAHDSSITLLGDRQTCTPILQGLDRYCSQVYFNVAYSSDGSTGRGGGVSLRAGASLDAEQTMIGYNISSVDGKQIAMSGAASQATLRNAAVVTDPAFIAFGSGAAVDVIAGTLDLRSSTVADHDIGLQFAPGSQGVMHRNIVANNNVGAILGGTVTGNCNLSQTAAESPSGVNNDVGSPGFFVGARSSYQIDSTSALAYDQCAAGPVVDIDGNPRPAGAQWDRGMFEAQ